MPTQGRHRVSESPEARRVVLAVLTVSVMLIASACGSSSVTTTSGASSSGPIAKISGKWTAVNDASTFCSVGRAIYAEPTSTAPPTTVAHECTLYLDWQMITGVEFRSNGTVIVAAKAIDPCSAQATVKDGNMGIGHFGCDGKVEHGALIDASGLERSTWKLDGKCLELDSSWFEQSRGSCESHRTDHFSAPGRPPASVVVPAPIKPAR